MTRKGIYFRLRPGAGEEYKRLHDEIWPSIRHLLTRAGIHNYSIWNVEEKLFAYYEVEDESECARVLASSEDYRKWRDLMETVVLVDEDTGRKEWDMRMVFFHQ